MKRGSGRTTEDGELWTTATERENDVWSVYAENGLNADKYVILIDLDGPAFPHVRAGQKANRVDSTSIYYTLEVAVNTSAQLFIGVINRIDGTDADICYFAGIPFLSGAQQEDRIISLRGVPSQVKLDCAEGVLGHGITNLKELNVVAVNTGITLDSPEGAGSITPGVGDIILKYDHTAGSSNFAIFVFYHTQ